MANQASVETLSSRPNPHNIDSEHIGLITDSLEKNSNIVYFFYKQYGQEIKQDIIVKIDSILKRNRDKFYEEFGIDANNEYMRLLKHSNKVKNIDSIYRNSMK